jgi:hypothetical protein
MPEYIPCGLDTGDKCPGCGKPILTGQLMWGDYHAAKSADQPSKAEISRALTIKGQIACRSGANCARSDVLLMLSADCPRRQDWRLTGSCGVGFPELVERLRG